MYTRGTSIDEWGATWNPKGTLFFVRRVAILRQGVRGLGGQGFLGQIIFLLIYVGFFLSYTAFCQGPPLKIGVCTPILSLFSTISLEGRHASTYSLFNCRLLNRFHTPLRAHPYLRRWYSTVSGSAVFHPRRGHCYILERVCTCL